MDFLPLCPVRGSLLCHMRHEKGLFGKSHPFEGAFGSRGARGQSRSLLSSTGRSFREVGVSVTWTLFLALGGFAMLLWPNLGEVKEAA